MTNAAGGCGDSLQGESGTGKDLVAKAFHYGSHRAERPFVAINCAALPATLIESELFGYEKGAFTDAKTRKEGLFEQAEGGTLLLDEIGELELSLQAKLLRVLEEGAFRRVGGLKDIPLDVRVIAASNRDLKTESEAGRFRLDLYYRLSIIQIDIPPLRERGDDVLLLAKHYINAIGSRLRLSSLDQTSIACSARHPAQCSSRVPLNPAAAASKPLSNHAWRALLLLSKFVATADSGPDSSGHIC